MINDTKYTTFIFWGNDVDTFADLTETFDEYELFIYFRMNNDNKD